VQNRSCQRRYYKTTSTRFVITFLELSLERVLLNLRHCLARHQKDCGYPCNGTTSAVASAVCTGRGNQSCLLFQLHCQTRHSSALAQRVRSSAHAAPKTRTMAKPRCADPLQALATRALVRACRQPRRTPCSCHFIESVFYCFFFFFFFIKPENLYFSSPPGLQGKLLGVYPLGLRSNSCGPTKGTPPPRITLRVN